MKKILAVTALCFPVIWPSASYAFDVPGDFSANVGFVTEYSFRGIAQSDEHPAIQGGFDYSHDSGFYAGIWGSNVDFNDGDESPY